MSMTLSVKYLGKLVPEIVKLSCPKTLRSVVGRTEATVQSTWILVTSDLVGISPSFEYISGYHVPQTGSSFKVHSILVEVIADSSTIHST